MIESKDREKWGAIIQDPSLRWNTTVKVVGNTNYVIYKFTSIGMIRHIYCPIYIHKSSMIINQAIIELFDIRYAQKDILDEDVM